METANGAKCAEKFDYERISSLIDSCDPTGPESARTQHGVGSEVQGGPGTSSSAVGPPSTQVKCSFNSSFVGQESKHMNISKNLNTSQSNGFGGTVGNSLSFGGPNSDFNNVSNSGCSGFSNSIHGGLTGGLLGGISSMIDDCNPNNTGNLSVPGAGSNSSIQVQTTLKRQRSEQNFHNLDLDTPQGQGVIGSNKRQYTKFKPNVNSSKTGVGPTNNPAVYHR